MTRLHLPLGPPALLVVLLLALAGSAGCDGDGATSPGSDPDAPDPSADVTDATDAMIEIGADTGPDVPVSGPAPALVILHTNDLHSQVFGTSPVSDYSPATTGDDTTTGGYARLATAIAEARAEAGATPVLLLDGGDFSMGTSLHSVAPTEAAELRLMDAMGYDAVTIGNHEFDFGPVGLAGMLAAGLPGDQHLQVVASNLAFDPADPRDDALATHFDDGRVLRHHVIELPGGLRVGIFGLLGDLAYSLAPGAVPVTVASPTQTAKEMVQLLREVEGVDLVVALSHAGLSEDDATMKGEDEQLPLDVPGIDVIVSGHSHTYMDEPLIIGDTLVVQAGEYGKSLGRLEIHLGDDGTVDTEAARVSYRTIPIDDAVAGDPAITAMVESFGSAVDAALFGLMGLSYDTPIAEFGAETTFSLTIDGMQENNMGDLVADAIRLGASSRVDGSVDVGITAGGVLRSPIARGQAGIIWAEDAFEVVPLGSGPDGSAGYPLVDIYLTADEVRQGLEILTTGAPLVGNTFYLQVSGLKFTYDPEGPFFHRVVDVFLGNEIDGYAAAPLDVSPDNPQLLRVAVSLYLARMLGTVEDYSMGFLSISPRDATGTPIPEGAIEQAIIDADAGAPGVQEYKVWQALIETFQAMPDLEPNGLPNVPERYATPQGRITAL